MDKTYIINVILLYAILVLIQGNSCQIEIAPKNTWALKGESVIFNCSIDGSLQIWRDYFSNDGAAIAVDDEVLEPYTNDFATQGDTSSYSLQLKQGWTDMSYGGTYGCEDTLRTGPPRRLAELIALESHPVFEYTSPGTTTVIEGDLVRYTCRVTYTGRWAPTMSWTDKDGNPVTSQSGPGAVEGSVVETYIEFNVAAADDGQMYNCRTYFEDVTSGPDPPTGDEDTTTPDYDNTKTSGTLIVHYPPRATAIRNGDGEDITDGSELHPGQIITCSSTSNPAVDEYEWTDLSDNSTLGDAAELTIDESWLGDLQLKCTVRNTMGENQDTVGEDSVTLGVSVINKLFVVNI